MAIQNTFSNMFKIFSAISPLLLGFFLVMSSLFNQNIKGLIYLAGVLLASVINIFLMNLFQSKRNPDESYTCDIFSLNPYLPFNNPAPTSLFIAFTLAYLILPMVFNNQLNYVIITFLLLLFVIDAFTKVQKKCTSAGGTLMGGLVGLLLGGAWYMLLHEAGYDSLLYFDELLSNKVACSRPSKQSFKCSVYKGGELISSNVV